jgi:hypothetical protein
LPELHTAAILIDKLDAGGLKGAPKGSLREANFKYEAKRRDLEDKFGVALASLREQYLAEVLDLRSPQKFVG